MTRPPLFEVVNRTAWSTALWRCQLCGARLRRPSVMHGMMHVKRDPDRVGVDASDPKRYRFYLKVQEGQRSGVEQR